MVALNHFSDDPAAFRADSFQVFAGHSLYFDRSAVFNDYMSGTCLRELALKALAASHDGDRDDRALRLRGDLEGARRSPSIRNWQYSRRIMIGMMGTFVKSFLAIKPVISGSVG